MPIARFRWIRDGIEQLGDNVVLNVSLGLFTMTLPNLTMNDGGAYTCMATSARSSRSDHIVLNVSENVEGIHDFYVHIYNVLDFTYCTCQ